MKKLVCLILTAFLLLSALTACSTDPQAPAVTDGGEPTAAPSSSGDSQTTGTPEPDDPPESPVSDFEYQLNSDGGITITKYIGNDANVVVPAYIEEKPVTEIGDAAFCLVDEIGNGMDNFRLKFVKLPDTVTSIGNSAFYRCLKLEHVELPANLQSLGDGAFGRCQSLTEIVIPETLTTISTAAFSKCSNLKTIHFPPSITRIENDAFSESGLETVQFEEGLKVIENNAFSDTSIRELIFPNSLQEIQDSAFSWCEKLEFVVLNEGLLTLGEMIFTNTALTEVIVPSTVENFTDYTFFGADSITKVKFEGSVPRNYIPLPEFPDEYRPDFTIYFHEGADGFTLPSWNGYPTKIW